MSFINIVLIIVAILILIFCSLSINNRHVEFDRVFSRLLDYCFRFNRHSRNGFLHIKGGASIKYHMIKNSIHSNGFTNDIDMVMVSTNKKANWKHNLLLEFLEGLRATFPYFTWSYDISTNHIVDDDIYLNKLPELVKIKLNGTKIFDVTYYDESHGDELKKQNMFRYAIKTLYNSDESGYYSKLRRLHPLRNLDPKNLEKLTITNLQIERLSLIKGLENQDYLLKNGISTANEKRDILHKLIGDETDSKKISSFNRKINRLETKYVDTSAIHKRVARYNKKLSIIDKMLK